MGYRIKLIFKGLAEELMGFLKDFLRIWCGFDSLAKQYNCEWRGANNMIFMKDLQLVVEAPYKPENCTGNDAPALEHLKKVLSGMRAKLNMNENK